MTKFIVNQTTSYTLAISTETGEMKLELADDLRESLRKLLENSETSADAAAGFLDLLGKDAAEYLDVMDAILDMDGALSQAHAAGGIEAMEAAMAEHAANNGFASDLAGRLAEKEGFGGFGSMFVEVPSTDIDAYIGWGTPAGDPYADDGSEEGKAAIEKAIGQGGLMQDSGGEDVSIGGFFGKLVEAAAYTVGGAVVGGAIGAGIGSIAPGAGTAVGAKAGIAVGSSAGLAYGMSEVVEYGKKVKGKLENEMIPADPDAEYAGHLDFTPPWVEAQVTEAPTYGQTLTDPNDESGVEGSKDFDPESLLGSKIIVDPESVQAAIKAEQVQAAVDLKLDSTTLPPEAEPEFHFNFGEKPDLGGGKDHAADDGGAMAIANGGGLGFQATLQTGLVDADNTSAAMLEGETAEQQMAIHAGEQMA